MAHLKKEESKVDWSQKPPTGAKEPDHSYSTEDEAAALLGKTPPPKPKAT